MSIFAKQYFTKLQVRLLDFYDITHKTLHQKINLWY